MKKAVLSFYILLFTSYLGFGQTWSALGTKSVSPGNASFIAVNNGTLYAGTSQMISCSPHGAVLQWNGTTWVQDSGIIGASINTSVVYNNNFIVGGQFSSPAANIAKQNGSAWVAMGSGTTGTNAFVVYNGSLYSGGLNDFEVWSGKGWVVADKNQINSICTLNVYNGELYAGGNFAQASGVANYIAKWNGTVWATVGSGINGTVYSLVNYNGKMYATGFFDSAGGQPCNNIAVWNDTTWAPVGKGLNSIGLTMTIFNNQLCVGGQFDSAGGNSANYIATWDGNNWNALGSGVNNKVTCLAAYDSVLYVGGIFTAAGGNTAFSLAQWTPGPNAIHEVISNSEEVKIYPNPGDGHFNIVIANEMKQSQFEIYNVLGEKIFQQFNIQNPTFKIDLTGQPNGVYFYRVTSEKGEPIASGKLIKQ